MKNIKNFFKNKTILITGGTGSFGNAFLNKILDLNFSEIRIFSRDEKKQNDMRDLFNNPKIKFYIGDVRSLDSVNDAMYGVDYIFHAAALKQVPSCEFYPIEAIKTNILGAENVIKSAIQNKVKKCLLLSTDKAVYPINAMGLSKSLMEKVMIAQSRNYAFSNLLLCATRYGNVMGSRGSVIPLFVSKIKNNEKLPITNPNMTRFLMSLEESVDLVLYGFTQAKAGDIFVHKAPACTIENLAKALCNLYNYKSKYNLIGVRHGEKNHETLISSEEMSKVIDNGKFYKIPADNRDLNYNKYFSKGNQSSNEFESYNSSNTKILKVKEVENLLIKKKVLKDL